MDRVLKESYLLNPRPSRRKQSGKGWKNGHMVTAVTVTVFVCGLVFSTVLKGMLSNTVMDAF